MADGTHIQWTDATWNPITGCSVVSPGCTNCYAMHLAGTRLKHHPSRAGLTVKTKAGPVWNGQVLFNEQWLDQPLRWKRPRRIFVCAHGDLFAEAVPDEWIDRVFVVMALAPQHAFQVLTKRAERMRNYVATPKRDEAWWEGGDRAAAEGLIYSREPRASEVYLRAGEGETPFPLPNVWLGVSVEDQARADERIPLLLATPAAVHFISAEPLLGPVDIRRWLDPTGIRCPDVDLDTKYLLPEEISYFQSPGSAEVRPLCPRGGQLATETGYDPALDWVIAGGESGPGARAMHPGWARSLRDQCVTAGIPFFYKQAGEYASVSEVEGPGEHYRFADGATVRRVGKKAAGRLLDGREWSEFPA